MSADQALSAATPFNSSRELCELLDPIGPDTFFAEYWERKPLFIKGGLKKLERLIPGGFGIAHFREAVRTAEANQVRGFRLWAQKLKERNLYIIYWPAGTLHTTRGLSDLSLTLHFVINHETFLNLFSRFLLSTFMSRPEWRHLPTIPAGGLTPGQVPDEVKEFFAARLREVSKFVDTLSPDSLDFNREWHKLLAAPGELILPQLLPAPAEVEKRAIEPGDVLRLPNTAPITYTFGIDADGERSFYLYFADKELSLSGEWFDFLQTLVRQESFVAESATGWAHDRPAYDWETVRTYLQVMLDQGILERQESPT